LLRSELSIASGELDNPCSEGWLDDRLYIRPLLRSEQSMVVALPNDLMTALKHQIIVLSHQFACVADLAAAFQAVVSSNVVRSLLRTDTEFVETIEREGTLVRQRLKFDDTKEIHLIVATDDLKGFDPSTPWGTRDTQAIRKPSFSISAGRQSG
jgi:hypothetical protein